MKRLINLFLILIMVMNLTILGCGKKETNQYVPNLFREGI